ncbi:MAG: glycogen synthase GlgA [Candidatus Margulisiibacteriota bacterium]
MKILFISPEVVPFAKTGGLADVAGSLPKALKKIGHDVRVFMPLYKKISKSEIRNTKQIRIVLNNKEEIVEIYEGKVPGTDVIVYFLGHEGYFGSRDDLYQVKGVDFPDNLERFSLFCQAVLPFLKEIDWKPDVIHCNDWQSALVIAHLKTTYKEDPFFKRTASVYSIHNMAYLGQFPKDKFPSTGLPASAFSAEGIEFWGDIALSKAGLSYVDVINTVSETYAKEIQTKDFGCGLDGLLRFRTKDVFGIVNGLDYDVWNPATDTIIPKRYSPATLSLKVEDKLALQKLSNLPIKKEVPIIGMITRLADQKGFDILAEALDQIMHEQCQLIILGTGDQKYHDLLLKMKKKYPEHIGVNLGFDAALAELIYAGSDMFMMPSLYEPCGLGQLISFKYGTVPIVRKTGGLADTVNDFVPATGKGEGFVFEEYSAKALLDAVRRACKVYLNKPAWTKLQFKIMQLDYSWDSSAKKYVSLYMKALSKIGIRAL